MTEPVFQLDAVKAAAGASGAAPRAHAVLGASSYKRWRRKNCPGSIRLSRGMPNESTVYAAEGSVAHAIGERKVLKRIGRAPDDDFEQRHAVGCKVLHKDDDDATGHLIEITEEMHIATDFYADTVLAEYNPEDGDILLVEARVDLSDIHPGMFGTSDIVLVKVKARKIIVFDLKYGAGIAVDAEENEQLMYYCVGGLLKTKAPVELAEVVIVQPRAFHAEGPVRRWPFRAVQLFDFIDELKLDALATEDPNAPTRAGDHCRFCPAGPICDTRREFVLTQAQADFAPVNLSKAAADFVPPYDPAKLNESLRAIPNIRSWCDSVEKFARSEQLQGRGSSGHKIVRGNGSRVLRKRDQALAYLEFRHDVAESAMWTEPELKSVAQLEELLPNGKARKEFNALYVEKIPGALILAPIESKKPAVNNLAAAQTDFTAVNVDAE